MKICAFQDKGAQTGKIGPYGAEFVWHFGTYTNDANDVDADDARRTKHDCTTLWLMNQKWGFYC